MKTRKNIVDNAFTVLANTICILESKINKQSCTINVLRNQIKELLVIQHQQQQQKQYIDYLEGKIK